LAQAILAEVILGQAGWAGVSKPLH